MDTIIVGISVLGAIAYFARKIYHNLSGKGGCGCGCGGNNQSSTGCGGCGKR